MPVMIDDPEMEREIRAKRANRSPGARDEVWEGVLVVPPLPNIEHQILATDFALAFSVLLDRAAGDVVCVGANVSDREGLARKLPRTGRARCSAHEQGEVRRHALSGPAGLGGRNRQPRRRPAAQPRLLRKCEHARTAYRGPLPVGSRTVPARGRENGTGRHRNRGERRGSDKRRSSLHDSGQRLREATGGSRRIRRHRADVDRVTPVHLAFLHTARTVPLPAALSNFVGRSFPGSANAIVITSPSTFTMPSRVLPS
jgi:hypothetical protein